MNIKKSKFVPESSEVKNEATASFKRPADSFGPVPEQPVNSARERHNESLGYGAQMSNEFNVRSSDSYSVANFNGENTDSAFNTKRTVGRANTDKLDKAGSDFQIEER